MLIQINTNIAAIAQDLIHVQNIPDGGMGKNVITF